MKRRRFVLILMVCCTLFTSACTRYTTPNSLINAPVLAENENTANSGDFNNVVKKFLPSGAQLMLQSDIVTGKNINLIDLDNDNSNEIIAFFQLENKLDKGVIILKNKNSNWVKIFQKNIQCISISRFESLNIFDKTQKSILIGFNISGLAGSQYSAITFKDGKIEERNMGIWNKFQVLNTLDKIDKDFVAAVWQKNTGNLMNVDIIKFNNRGVYYTEDFYEDYAPEIEKYYTDFLDSKPENQLAMKGLIKAQINSGEEKEALETIENLKQIRLSGSRIFPIQEDEFKLLQAQNYSKLKRYDEALEVLESLISECQESIKKHQEEDDKKKAQYDQYRNYTTMDLESKVGDAYLEEGKILNALRKKDTAKDKFNEALKIYEKLYEEGFYGEQEYINISKDLDIDTAKEQIQNLGI